MKAIQLNAIIIAIKNIRIYYSGRNRSFIYVFTHHLEKNVSSMQDLLKY
jgi:hypothetical protein